MLLIKIYLDFQTHTSAKLQSYNFDLICQGLNWKLYFCGGFFFKKTVVLIFAWKSQKSKNSKKCYYYCFISIFTIMYVRSYRLEFWYPGLNQNLHTSRGRLLWNIIDFELLHQNPDGPKITRLGWLIYLIISLFKLTFLSTYMLDCFHQDVSWNVHTCWGGFV